MVTQRNQQSQPQRILDQPVSLFQGAKTVKPRGVCSLGEVLTAIRDGTYRATTAHVRQHKTRGKAVYRKAKERLLAFTPCCALRTRDGKVPMADKLVSVTGIVHYDFDDVPDPALLKSRLASTPATVFAFLSPGGDGVKVGIAVGGITDDSSYKHPWHVVLRRLKKTYPDLHISEDEHVKFLHALCFVSDDPDIYMNPDAMPLDIPVQPPDEEAPLPEMAAQSSADFDPVEITRALKVLPAESYDAWIAVGQALHSTGHPLARGLWDWWSSQSTKYKQSAQDSKWKSFTRGGGRTLGDLYTLAHQHGWRRFKTPTADAEERTNGTHTGPQGTRVLLSTAEDVREEALTWLWDHYIPLKMVTLVDGDPGVGKTMFGCQLATNVTRGYPMPDQLGTLTRSTGEAGHVLMVAMEDHLGAVVRPRLRRAGADLSKITVVLGCEEVTDQPRVFTLADLPLLTEYMERCRPRLVYVDAIQSVVGPKADINRANVVTSLLAPLKTLAERYDCAIVCNRHPAKEGQTSAKLQYRGLGSQAFVGTVRAGLFIEEHPADPTKALIIAYKSNTGHCGRTQVFSKARGVFEWCGASRLTAALLAGSGPGPSPRERVKACLWLETVLQPEEAILASAVYEMVETQDLDFSKKILRLAAEALGVQKTNVRGDFVWILPPLPSLQEEEKEEVEEVAGTGVSGVSGVSGSTDEKIDVMVTLPGTNRNTSSERPPERPDDPVYPVHPDDPDTPVLTDESPSPSVSTAEQGICAPSAPKQPPDASDEEGAKEVGSTIISRGMTTDLHAYLLEELQEGVDKDDDEEGDFL
jgi:hypothetical protein